MLFYHCTSPVNAAAIADGGFRDATGSLKYHFLDGFTLTGVWISARRAEYEAGPVGFRIEIPEDVIADFEIVEEGRPADADHYREWCVPAELLNRYFCDRTIFDALKLKPEVDPDELESLTV